ncbi:hypothetical protein B0H17DRAFT_1177659, partial [Mycena rosella]
MLFLRLESATLSHPEVNIHRPKAIQRPTTSCLFPLSTSCPTIPSLRITPPAKLRPTAAPKGSGKATRKPRTDTRHLN